jgi:hypothetical protein
MIRPKLTQRLPGLPRVNEQLPFVQVSPDEIGGWDSQYTVQGRQDWFLVWVIEGFSVA